MTPYHKAKSVHLSQVPLRYDQPQIRISPEDISIYTASDRVKLSIHADGFVQFSSERGNKIISGRDAITGQPRGLGIFSNPIDRPIETGPTWGYHFWGLHDFEPLNASSPRNTVTYSETDFYYRYCTPDSWGTYLLEAFLFPNSLAEFVQHKPNKSVLSLYFPRYQETLDSTRGSWFTFRFLPLPNQPVFMGIIVSRLPKALPGQEREKRPVSGFSLGSPSEIDPRKHALYATYPDPTPGKYLGSLDFKPQVPQVRPTTPSTNH